MRIALAQINPTVGDLEGNAKKILEFVKKAERQEADIVVFPELAITGYPPEDLLLKQSFIEDNLRVLRKLSKSIKKTTVIIGFVDRPKKDIFKDIFNAAAVISKGKIRGIAHKILLPNYGVFDEKRYFKPGSKPLIFSQSPQRLNLCKFGVHPHTYSFDNIERRLHASREATSSCVVRNTNIAERVGVGVNICEDVWYDGGPTRTQAKKGAKLIFTINASPYHAGKIKQREAVVRRQAKRNRVWICYVNLVGGQDELVFDGQSMVINPNGEVVARAKAFEEELLVVEITSDLRFKIKDLRSRPQKSLSLEEEVYQALLLGLRDYVRKNGFQKVVIGLSGGIDSSLVAALAVDALGKENVIGVRLPSPYSSFHSKEDAQQLAKNLGIQLLTIPIGGAYRSYLNTLNPQFRRLKPGFKPDVTEENIQARIRGNILMALSNKFGWLVLTTGNKSETSVGYATLYGDMAGGFAPIKDVPKTLVYRLAKWRNTRGKVVPDRVIRKAPSAELRPGQKDTDTLPPYEVLDPILKLYVEEDRDAKEIIGRGFKKDVVRRVLSMVDGNEYKRRQAPPGIKITPKAFGKDRRIPITNRYV